MAQPAQKTRSKKRPQRKAKDSEESLRRKQDKVRAKTAGSGPASDADKTAQPAYLQPKMAVSAPGDAQEQEADRMAEKVGRMPAGDAAGKGQTLQRAAAGPGADKGGPQSLQTKTQPSDTAQPLMRAEDEAVQREAEESLQASGAPELSPETEQKIESLRGRGRPLPEEVRRDMESKLNADFSRVSIHTGADANQLCRQINARAFTVGRDIFFADGEYASQTQKGRKLLAHELTHVLQQGSGVSRKVFRDANDTSSSESGGLDDSDSDSGGSEVYHRGQGWLEFDNLNYPKMPKWNGSYSSYLPLIKHRDYRAADRGTNQNSKWKSEVDKSISNIVDELKEVEGYSEEAADSHLTFAVPSAYAALSGDEDQDGNWNTNVLYLRGSLQEIAEQTVKPTWMRNGEPVGTGLSYRKRFEVEHVIEAQLGCTSPRGDGFELKSNIDDKGNYVLLRGQRNQEKTNAVSRSMKAEIEAFLEGNEDEYRGKQFQEWTPTGLRNHLSVQFNNVTESTELVDISENDVWTLGEISSGEHIKALGSDNIKCVTLSQLEDQVPDHALWVFHSKDGGFKKTLKRAGPEETAVHSDSLNFLAPFKVHADSQIYNLNSAQADDDLAVLKFYVPDDTDSDLEPMALDREVRIKSMGGSRKLAYFEEGKARELASLNEVAGLSPIEVDEAGFAPEGIAIRGRIVPTPAIIEGAYVNFELLGNSLTFSRTFSTDDIKVPAPFSVDVCSITLEAGTEGFGASGQIDFSIDKIGDGSAEAEYHSQRGLSVCGEFNFDERIFGRGTNAQVDFAYENDAWSVGGEITIPRGKVPGVDSATIQVDYSETDGFSARGEAELDVPGVENGTLEITQSEEEGFRIAGEFDLSADTPGIRGGSISAEVAEKPDGTGYAVRASGEAQPDIPGIDSSLEVSYNDGAFTAEVRAGYERGMLSGEINAGVTNRTVNEDGSLAETAEEGNPLVVYGGGELTLQLAPWLEGTAGVQFSPDGELTVTGRIGLPDELEIFPRYDIDKDIFDIDVQTPIIPGVVAEIGGGLGAEAGIGPGVLNELSLEVTYNPDHEEDTTVTGDARLRIPADAGLRLSVNAGVGLGITGASVTGGLEIGGTLGIEGAAEAGVHVEWSPSQGVDLEAELSVEAQPSFTFDITGYVKVDTFIATLYEKEWELYSFTFGSDYTFGISMPVHYREGEPFDISTDDIEFQVPDIDTDRLLDGLIDRVT